MAIQNLEVDLDLKQNLNIYATCKQLDNLTLICNIYDNSTQADLSNYNVRLKALKSDKVALIQETSITVSNNIVTIVADEQLTTTSGKTLIELQFINKTSGLKKATFNLILIVVASTVEVNATISTSTYTLLQELENKLDQASDFFENIDEAITANTNLIASTNTANSTKTSLDTSNTTALATKTALDTSNTTANTTKTALNTSITNANTAKTALDTSKSNADASKVALDTSITNANTFVSQHGDIIDLDNRVNQNTASLSHIVSEQETQNANIANKVDKVTGKGLSTNDYDNTEKAQVANNTSTIAIHTSQISSLASGAPKSVSLVANMTDTTKNYVYTGSESGYTAGNWYYYNGSTWVSGGVYQSTGIANNSISKEKINSMLPFNKLNFIKCGKNLLDSTSLIHGYYLSVNNILNPSAIYCVTDYIPIVHGESLTLWRDLTVDNNSDKIRGIRIATYFDANYNVLTSYSYDNSSLVNESITANGTEIAYVRLSFFDNYNDGKTIIEYGLSSEISYEFEDFYYDINGLKLDNSQFEQYINNNKDNIITNNSISKEKINNYSISESKTNFISLANTNLLNEDTCLLNYYLDVNGNLVSHTNYAVTDYIEAKNGDSFVMWRNKDTTGDPKRAIRFITCFDKDYKVIPTSSIDNSSQQTVLTLNGSDIAYVKLTIGKGYLDKKTMIEKASTPSTIFHNFKYKMNGAEIYNPLYGKSILSFGDSIMRGAGNNDIGLADIIAERNNMTCYNEAVSGATIMATQDNNIPKQITNSTTTNPDYIVMDGYINDALISNITGILGSISPYFGADFGTDTFCGQLETTIRELLIKYIGSKIVYVMVHHMNTRDDAVVKQLHDLTKSICKKWGIAVVDLYEEGILNTYIEGYRSPYTGNNGDGTHPNQLGYEMFYVSQTEAKLKSLSI